MSRLTKAKVEATTRQLLENDLVKIEATISALLSEYPPQLDTTSLLLASLPEDIKQQMAAGEKMSPMLVEQIANELIDINVDQIFVAVHDLAKTPSGDISPMQVLQLQGLQKKMALTLIMPKPDLLAKGEFSSTMNTLKLELVKLITTQVWQNLYPDRKERAMVNKEHKRRIR